MAHTKVEAEPDQPEEQLDRAIEELRGVLREEESRPDAGLGANSSIIMTIPVDVQIILGSTEMPVCQATTYRRAGPDHHLAQYGTSRPPVRRPWRGRRRCAVVPIACRMPHAARVPRTYSSH